MNYKTNFGILDKIIAKDEAGTIIGWDKGVTTKNIKNYRILKSLINEIETKLHLRDYSNNKLPFRNTIEVLNKYFYTEVARGNLVEVSPNRAIIYGEIESTWINNKENAKINTNKWKIHHLLKTLLDLHLMSKDDEDAIFEYNKLVNSEMHAVNEFYIENNVDGYFIGDNFHVAPIGFDLYLKQVELLHKTIHILFRILYPEVEGTDDKFDKTIYNDGRESFKHIKHKDEFFSLLGEPCPLCEKGQLSNPRSILFPNGPYLQCYICKAKLSANLNLKSRDEAHECHNHDCIGTFRETVSYKEGAFNYRKAKLQCDHCKAFDLEN